MTEFTEWTVKIVRAYVIEAADTLMKCPGYNPPDLAEAAPIVETDTYGKDHTPVRQTAAPAAISRMEKVWTWINALPDADDRRLLYAWGQAKARKRFKIQRFANKNGMTTDILRHRIDMICNQICEQLNRHCSIRLNDRASHFAEIDAESDQSKSSSGSRASPHSWAAEDAKPIDLSENSRDRLSLVERLRQAVPRNANPDEPHRKGNHRHKRGGNRQEARA